MKDFYLQGMFSLLILTGLTVSIYVYESTNELIQVTFYDKQPVNVVANAQLLSNNSVNQINAEVLELLERESDMIVQSEFYAQNYQDSQFFEEVAQGLKNHLGFVLVLYELTDEEFPVLTQKTPRVPLEANLSEKVAISREQAEQFVRNDLESLWSEYEALESILTAKDQKVRAAYQNLVQNKIR
jgi:hypothetical protein